MDDGIFFMTLTTFRSLGLLFAWIVSLCGFRYETCEYADLFRKIYCMVIFCFVLNSYVEILKKKREYYFGVDALKKMLCSTFFFSMSLILLINRNVY